MTCPYNMTATLMAFVTLVMVTLVPVIGQIRTAPKTRQTAEKVEAPMDDHAHHEIGAVDCGCGWHPSCVGLHPDPGVIEITEEGVAVVESGLTLRQAHEIRTGCSPEHLCDECESYLT